jgi:hypothetical protein
MQLRVQEVDWWKMLTKDKEEGSSLGQGEPPTTYRPGKASANPRGSFGAKMTIERIPHWVAVARP